jgi:acetylornithine deacetylase/succinyl-diaminopimelate desuccinylase-like protein
VTAPLLTARDHDLLLRLLDLPTAGPLETGLDGPRPRLWEAQRAYAAAAADAGLRVVHHSPAAPDAVLRDDVPLPVRRAVADDPHFLVDQPSLVLRLGGEQPRERVIAFNVHLDTVADLPPARFDGVRFTGRGAIDAKGPAVALLAGVRAARARLAAGAVPADEIAVLIQAVAGEEGGALGTFGTRPLVEAGHYGRLNVVCEPTGNRHLPRATAAMTARVHVAGRDAVDDRPEAGHNASVLLGFLAQHLAHALTTADVPEGRVCVAGLRTGTLHNRVYGSGDLLLNLAYASQDAADRLAGACERALADGLREFTARFGDVAPFALTAADAAAVTRLEWLKRGLPTLAAQDPWAERLLARAGVSRCPADQPAFTSDAIWFADLPDTYTTVLGPGTLAGNNAHAAGEYADLADLERFARTVADLIVTFARSC